MIKLMKSKSVVVFGALLVTLNSFGQTIPDGLKNLDAERFTAANTIFEKIAATPTPENLFYQGYSLLRSPEGTKPEVLAKANSIFEKAISLDKKGSPINSIGLGMVKLAKKDFAGAKLTFDEVKKATKSKDPIALYRIAEAYTMFDGATDPAEAIMNIDLALEKAKVKDDPNFYLVKSKAYLLKNEGGDAMNALVNAERIGKNLANTYARMSEVWLRGKNYKEAKDALDKALAADKEFAPLYKYLSSYYQTFQKWGESAEAAKKYLAYSDGDCGSKLRYAKIAFISKDFDNVLKTVDEVKTCSSDPIVYRLAGMSKFEQNKGQEAIDQFNQYLNKAQKTDIMGLDYGYIGRSYLSLADADKRNLNDSIGISYINKAVSMGDTTIDYYSNIADTFKSRKQYDKAAYYFEKVISTKKKPVGGDYANLAILFFQTQNWEKAETNWEKVIESYGDTWADAFIFSARSKYYKNPNDSTFAASLRYEKYLSLLTDAQKAEAKFKKNVVESYKYLAIKEFSMNKDAAKATTYINELLKYDPTNAEALDLMNSINGVKPAAPAPAAAPVQAPKTGSTPSPSANTTKPATPAKTSAVKASSKK
jgi:tetratricopeptide (TPR) repeat protein